VSAAPPHEAEALRLRERQAHRFAADLASGVADQRGLSAKNVGTNGVTGNVSELRTKSELTVRIEKQRSVGTAASWV
jgi:hypothetical protein